MSDGLRPWKDWHHTWRASSCAAPQSLGGCAVGGFESSVPLLQWSVGAWEMLVAVRAFSPSKPRVFAVYLCGGVLCNCWHALFVRQSRIDKRTWSRREEDLVGLFCAAAETCQTSQSDLLSLYLCSKQLPCRSFPFRILLAPRRHPNLEHFCQLWYSMFTVIFLLRFPSGIQASFNSSAHCLKVSIVLVAARQLCSSNHSNVLTVTWRWHHEIDECIEGVQLRSCRQWWSLKTEDISH